MELPVCSRPYPEMTSSVHDPQDERGLRPSSFGRLFLPIALSILLLFFSRSAAAQPEVISPDRASIILSVENARSSAATERLEKTIAQLLEASNQAKSLGDYLLSAAISNVIGEIYERQGNYQNALMQYEQGLQAIATQQAGVAIDIKRALEDLLASEKSYPTLRGASISTDLYRGEIEDLRRILDQPSERAAREIAVLLTMNAANMYLKQNQFAQADTLYQKALDIARYTGFLLRQREIYANMAWAAIKERRFDAAGKLLHAALEEEHDRLDAVELRRAFLAVGVNARETGDDVKAIAQLKKAVILYDRAADVRGKNQALAHLATAYLQRGELEEAKSYYVQALELNEGINDGTTTCHANGGLAKTYYRLGQWDAAVEYYSRFADCVESVSKPWFTDQGKVGVLEDYATFFREYSDVTLQVGQKTGDFTRAWKVIESGRAKALTSLLEARQTRTPLRSGNLPTCLSFCPQWTQGSSSDPRVQMAPGVNAQPQESGNQKEIPPVNPPAVTFLETYVLADRTAIFVRQLDGSVKGSVVDIGAEALARLITSYRHALEVDVPRGVKIASPPSEPKPVVLAQRFSEQEISKQLYRLLIDPVKRLLPQSSKQTIVIVPHQTLWFLPFAALRDGNNAFFGDQHVLTYAISEAAWNTVATKARTADHHHVSAWVVGNPDMPPQPVTRCGSRFELDALPGAEEEARTIADLLGHERAQLFTRSQADRLRLDAWHQDFSVLHFATHGVACPSDPLSSFVVLKELTRDDLSFDPTSQTLSVRADSRLPVTLVDPLLDVQKRDTFSGEKPSLPPKPLDLHYPGLLDARTIINQFSLDADLVTLSACQTGLGQLSGEGMIGFTRAFLAAGSRSLLVSLWRVDDQSTMELMVSFYRQYLTHGNKGLALQQAMAETSKRYPEPRYWAGFTLIGMAE
jgi:CHAT domain-containing protein/tetratricopeptide (TPR) repeat protein